MRPLATALVLLGVAASHGCGGGSSETVGTTNTARGSPPLELDLRTPDNAFLSVGDMRGRVVLLFLFATFDGVSQAAVRPLSRFVRAHPEVDVVAVAVQPDARQLADAWQAALDPPFLVTYDPEDRIAEGTSPLGELAAVPTYVFLDAEGRETERYVGFASVNKLEAMLARTTRAE
jgi:hypothetical protein